ncbi:MAG: DUF1109 domain-containing protein [Candidatus Binatia bacterium]
MVQREELEKETKVFSRLTEELVADLQPVKPVRLGLFYVFGAGVGLVAICLMLVVLGPRSDLAGQLGSSSFLAVLAALSFVAISSVVLAVRVSIPGRRINRLLALTVVVAPPVLALTVFLLSPWGGSWPGWDGIVMGFRKCTGSIVVTAALPWAATVALLHRLAPFRYMLAGVFAGLSALTMGAVGLHFSCPVGNSFHLAFSHYLPLSVLSFAAGIPAAFLFRAMDGYRGQR